MPARLASVIDAMAPDREFGALALGADRYVSQQLAGDSAVWNGAVEHGVAGLEAEAFVRFGAGLDGLALSRREELLRAVETEDWFEKLTELVAEGLYSDPDNGGNLGARSWERLGYRHGLPERPSGPPKRTPAERAPVAFDDRDFDVIVVGSGAGGGIVASELALAGKSVLLVERGEWLSYADSGHRDHLRNHRLSLYGNNTGPGPEGFPRVFVDGDGRERVVAPAEFDYNNNAMCVGSGTFVYGGMAWRFHPDDFRMASRYGVPEGSSLADWPISYDDLAPWYDKAEWEIGVSGDGGGNRHQGARAKPYPMPPVKAYASAASLRAGAERLGLSTFAPPVLINSVPREGREACIECGSCVGFPCPSDAKNGTQNTVIPRALATGRLVLATGTTVERVETDLAGKVVGVSLVRQAGDVRQSVRAKAVVLAGGAIETARLLLASATTREPEGLGNGHDLVGRNLQGHYYPTAFGLFEDEVFAERGPGVTIATCDFNHGNDGIIGGAMLADDFVMPPVIFWRQAWPPDQRRWGAEAERFMGSAYRRVNQVKGPVQEIPDPSSRVQLDGAVRDRFGLPVARLSGMTHPETVRTAAFMLERASDWLRASGATRIWGKPPGRRLSGFQHQAGTCRMGSDPAQSVTDAYGRVWGHENLFVSDGSLHPTNGGFNPVLTIMALAFRNADHIASSL